MEYYFIVQKRRKISLLVPLSLKHLLFYLKSKMNVP